MAKKRRPARLYDQPISQADIHSLETEEDLPKTRPKEGPAQYTPIPKAEDVIPFIEGIESDEQGKMLEQQQDQFGTLPEKKGRKKQR